MSYRVDGALMYARQIDGSWEIIEAMPGGAAGNTSIALDGDGNPHIVHEGGSWAVSYASFDGVSWVDEEIYSSSWGYGPNAGARSIVVDSEGTPHVTIGQEAYSSSGDQARIIIASRSAADTWDRQTLTLSGRISTPTIAMDSSDGNHVTWTEYLGSYLYYATGPSGAVVSEVASTSAGCCGDAHVAIDSVDSPHVAFELVSIWELAHTWLDGGAWSVETLLEEFYYLNDLHLDSVDQLHYAYVVSAADAGPIYTYAMPDGASWGHVGVIGDFEQCQMALGPDDTAHFVCASATGLVYIDSVL